MFDLTSNATARFARAKKAKPDDTEPKRLTRLNRVAAIQKAKSMVLAAENSTPDSKRHQTDVLRSLSEERIIGSDDLKSIDYLELAISMARAVGLVRLPDGAATGFLVGPALAITNHHVIGSQSEATSASFQLDFQDDVQGNPLPVESFSFDPTRFFITEEDLDFTLCAIQPVSASGKLLSNYPWIKLIPQLGKIAVGDPINIVQHPNGGLKQIAFRENKIIAMPDTDKRHLYYTTDTDRGSSGSPCFNDQWELVALHRQGVAKTDAEGKYLKKDGGVFDERTDDPASIDWIANEGSRVSAIVNYLQGLRLSGSQANLLNLAMTSTPPNPIELARDQHASNNYNMPRSSQSSNTTPIDAYSITWSLPVSITVSLGAPANASRLANNDSPPPGVIGFSDGPEPRVAFSKKVISDADQASNGQEKVEINQDYGDREGYDPNFLGFLVPLPTLSGDLLKDTAEVILNSRVHGDPHELAYYHYSVYMNKVRRTAWFSAANLDGYMRKRPNIGKREGDRWYVDPRLSSDDQLDQRAFEPGIDRGHLTRREDIAWGDDVASTINANNDSFHLTNCSLQASAFNRGKDRWQGLEQFLLEKHAKKENRRMVVITGPLFAGNDPIYRNERMNYSVRCPLQFWKVCVLEKSDGTPSATAFTLGQEDIKDLPGFEEEIFDVGAAQITIDELEHRTGLAFGNLRTHDHFASTGEPSLEVAIFNRTFRRKPIRSGADIVV